MDVLHHADDAAKVMAEAGRVARKHIIIKDHLTDGFLNEPVLKFMDYVGNKRHGVALPYYYMSCLLYTSPSPRDKRQSRMPSSA